MKTFLISGFLAAVLIASFVFAEDIKPVKPSPKDKCQVCGMFVAKYTNWVAEIIFRDGSYVFFDGPKDMFTYYFDISAYNPSKKTSDVAAVYVTEYYSARMMPAEKLFFVRGSDVNGPMGRELVPIEGEAKAKEFMKDHRGKKILKFNEISREALK